MTATRLEALYDAHAAGLFRYARSILRDDQAAKDVLQEVFVKLARAESPALENEKAWLYRLAHNGAIDLLRRAATRQEHRVQLSEPEPDLPPFSSETDRLELARQLESAICRLPPEQQSVTRLRLWQELTFEEIATIQGIPPNTAASRFRYALQKLRVHLKPLYEEWKY